MSSTPVPEWIQQASFVFSGDVIAIGESSLRVLPPASDFVTVRFERGFRVDRVLGKLDKRPITVQLKDAVDSAAVRHGQKWIFFTRAWVHGEEIAVKAFARLRADAKSEEEVQRIVDELPELHLKKRIASATLIVHGKVVDIARDREAPRTGGEHDPFWMRATIDVKHVLKSQHQSEEHRAALKRAILLFPGSRDHAFRHTPRPAVGQEAVFLLHPTPERFPPGAHIAPDPADIQPVEGVAKLRQLLGDAPPPR